MRKIKILLILGAGVSMLAQSSPLGEGESGMGPHRGGKYFSGETDPSLVREIRVFYLDNVQYWARISEVGLLSSPDWTPSKPLPLDFAKVESVARQELGRLVSDESTWEVTGFHLRPVRVGATETEGPHPEIRYAMKWFFQVEMKPMSSRRVEGAGEHPASFWVFIDLSGRPGKIQAHNP